jgi:nucleotide-binding universal stress UspA family protein
VIGVRPTRDADARRIVVGVDGSATQAVLQRAECPVAVVR